MKVRLALIILAILCSCRQGGSQFGKIETASPISVQRFDENSFPLDICARRDSSEAVNTVRYSFHSEDCLCTSYPLLLCDNPQNWTVTVNGETPVLIGENYIIAGLVHVGNNVIEISGSGDTSTFCISGEFDVMNSDSAGWYLDSAKILELGSLASQGLPFYSGTVSYLRSYDVPEKVGRRIFRLSEWKGTSCELWVNFVKVADITSRTFKKNIGPFLEHGRNELELRITGQGDFGLLKEYTVE